MSECKPIALSGGHLLTVNEADVLKCSRHWVCSWLPTEPHLRIGNRTMSMLNMVERGRLAPRNLITETIALEKAFGVIEQMSKFENIGISVINQF